jgi:tol-pal system protein YbgF
MTRRVPSIILGLLLLSAALPAPSPAQSRDIIQIQQNLALLQGLVREMQRNFDEKMAVMRTLVEQSSQQAPQVGAQLTELQTSVQNSMATTGQKMDTVAQQVQGLQGSIDDLRARLDRLADQVTKLQSSSQNISSGMGGMSMGGFSSDPGSGTPPSPDVLYNTALRDYNSGNYPLALQEFQEYLRYYANSGFASSAQYFIGDIYYQQGMFEKAVQEYDKAIEQYPDGNMTAAAMLKKGFALINMNMRSQGVQELEMLLQKFPNTPEAQLAQDKLNTLPPSARRTR